MNKNILTPILIIFVVLGGIAIFSVFNSSDKSDLDSSNLDSVGTATMPADDAMMDDDKMMEMDANAYVVTEAKAMYKVYKDFLLKDDIEVIGTAEDVEVSMVENDDTDMLNINARVNLLDLVTDSDFRDSDLQKLWDVPEATLETSIALADLPEEGEFSLDVPATLTINGITKEVTFAVTGSQDASMFTAEGTLDAVMSEYGITPPSAAEIYTVDDEFQVMFSVTGQKPVMNEDEAMMEDDSMMMEDAGAMDKDEMMTGDDESMMAQ